MWVPSPIISKSMSEYSTERRGMPQIGAERRASGAGHRIQSHACQQMPAVARRLQQSMIVFEHSSPEKRVYPPHRVSRYNRREPAPGSKDQTTAWSDCARLATWFPITGDSCPWWQLRAAPRTPISTLDTRRDGAGSPLPRRRLETMRLVLPPPNASVSRIGPASIPTPLVGIWAHALWLSPCPLTVSPNRCACSRRAPLLSRPSWPGCGTAGTPDARADDAEVSGRHRNV